MELQWKIKGHVFYGPQPSCRDTKVVLENVSFLHVNAAGFAYWDSWIPSSRDGAVFISKHARFHLTMWPLNSADLKLVDCEVWVCSMQRRLDCTMICDVDIRQSKAATTMFLLSYVVFIQIWVLVSFHLGHSVFLPRKVSFTVSLLSLLLYLQLHDIALSTLIVLTSSAFISFHPYDVFPLFFLQTYVVKIYLVA